MHLCQRCRIWCFLQNQLGWQLKPFSHNTASSFDILFHKQQGGTVGRPFMWRHYAFHLNRTYKGCVCQFRSSFSTLGALLEKGLLNHGRDSETDAVSTSMMKFSLNCIQKFQRHDLLWWQKRNSRQVGTAAQEHMIPGKEQASDSSVL